MVIKIIPDLRDEEKIAEIKEAKQTLQQDEWETYCLDRLCSDDEWFDAVYYADEDYGESVLSFWEDLLYERLMDDDRSFFASDLSGCEF